LCPAKQQDTPLLANLVEIVQISPKNAGACQTIRKTIGSGSQNSTMASTKNLTQRACTTSRIRVFCCLRRSAL